MENLFQAVKDAVPVPEAAARYGLEAGPSGMAAAPFTRTKPPASSSTTTTTSALAAIPTGTWSGSRPGFWGLRLTQPPAGSRRISACLPLPGTGKSPSPRSTRRAYLAQKAAREV